VSEAGRIRVAIIGSAFSVHVLGRAQALVAAGAETTIISPVPADRVVEGVNVVDPSPPRCRTALPAVERLRRLMSFVKAIRSVKADLLYVHYASGMGAWLAQTDPRRPLAVCVMGSDVSPHAMQKRPRLTQWLTQQLLRNADLVTAKSHYLATEVAKLGVPEDRIMETLWGVDPARFTEKNTDALRESLAIEKDARVVFSPRVLRRQYKIHLIIEAIPAILDKVPNARFVFAERKPQLAYRDEVKRQIDRSGLSHAVRFVGDIPFERMPDFYRLADVTVSLYEHEGFPQSVLESMAAGTPSVVGRIDAFRGTVEHSEHVWMVDFGAAPIAEAVLNLLQNQELRQNMIAMGHDFVAEKATLKTETQRVMARLRMLTDDNANNVKRRLWQRGAIVCGIILDSYTSKRRQVASGV